MVTKVSSEISLCETQTSDKFKELAKEHNSVLYLGTDTEADTCASDGFDGISHAFPVGQSAHVPIDLREFSGPLIGSATKREFDRFALYIRLERALDYLEKPCAIVCADTLRAGAVYAAYKAVKENLTAEGIADYAQKAALLYVDVPGFVTWISMLTAQYNERGRQPIIFRQLFEKQSSTYSYLLADPITKDAVLIDPVKETTERDIQYIDELGLRLCCTVETHVHADHITGASQLKSHYGPSVKSAVGRVNSVTSAEIQLSDYDSVSFGSRKIFALATPGHTAGCMCFVLDDMSKVFSGDALLIRGCGRTDFQGGSAAQLYDSVHRKLLDNAVLPDDCLVFPAHDYQGCSCSTIGEEKVLNPRLSKSKREFISIMDSLNLPEPAQISTAVPANQNGGVPRS